MAQLSIVKGTVGHETAEIARRLLPKVGLADRRTPILADLGGTTRAHRDRPRLGSKPWLMLLDEVISALDPELVGEVLGAIAQLAMDGTTMIIVTHEIAFTTKSPISSLS